MWHPPYKGLYLYVKLNLGYAIMSTRYRVPGIPPAMLKWARRRATRTTHADRMFERVHRVSCVNTFYSRAYHLPQIYH